MAKPNETTQLITWYFQTFLGRSPDRATFASRTKAMTPYVKEYGLDKLMEFYAFLAEQGYDMEESWGYVFWPRFIHAFASGDGKTLKACLWETSRDNSMPLLLAIRAACGLPTSRSYWSTKLELDTIHSLVSPNGNNLVFSPDDVIAAAKFLADNGADEPIVGLRRLGFIEKFLKGDDLTYYVESARTSKGFAGITTEDYAKGIDGW